MVLTETTQQPAGSHFLKEIANSPNQSLLPLTAKVNSQDHLEIGGCDVTELVKKFGSPLYIMDEHSIRVACRQYREGFANHYSGDSLVIYASKALNCLGICALVGSEGLGIDVASGGELYTALQAGISPEKIYFHGNNKSPQELREGIDCGCTIVADNWLELKTLAAIAQGTSTKVMLRVTPGIECHTHEYIRTGHLDSKFGFDPNQVEEVFNFLQQTPNLDFVGLHAHIGSQIFERQPHQDLASVLVDWLKQAMNLGLPVRELNVGGGLGIRYTEADDPPSIEEWTQAVAKAVEEACENANIDLPKLICEPGRSLVGTTGITAYTVGSEKTVPETRTYIAVDGGMSDNARPITYESVYRSLLANQMSASANKTVTVAGKHCESGDVLIKEALLPPTTAGDILVVMSTGAYGYSMASNYNRLLRPAMILVHEGNADVIIDRETYQDLIAQDRLPTRLKANK
ncbi:diaminopimelate decarboxylase [Euhalothece natronophila Z-M001]|uniref:Diaminopimelate decarboxylase n=1 Tax=Euhalothece natronophila Z-M001 TaxID=522448 RepID=A0A5B8NLN7_9CHRO|nr:diaminopimelate decarboxylase [Euhalothece natronophila]QDZ39175.1 diaminopimelate decarboxylase [Euhalothece natronophila Z-M001]